MELASLVHQYYEPLIERYSGTILPEQLKALTAILRCRTPASGELYVECPDCKHGEWRPLSCGNRHCPRCQNHQTSLWIDRQMEKLMPVPYYMVTFTLPYQLRPLAYARQKTAYALMFKCAAAVLRNFGFKKKHLGAEIGMTMVLHTHARNLDYHPHIHVVVPGGGIDKRLCKWKRIKGDYLFNGRALAKAFRGKFLAEAKMAGLTIPGNVPKKWVAHCKHVGSGATALQYLSRYLYRGVISEKNIVDNKDGVVTFKYIDSDSGELRYRKLKGEQFLKLLLKHVLPRGFRRARDYGFLHGNAKKLRTLVQLILHVIIRPQPPRTRPTFSCRCCQATLRILRFRNDYVQSG